MLKNAGNVYFRACGSEYNIMKRGGLLCMINIFEEQIMSLLEN